MTCKDLGPLLLSLGDASLPPAEEARARAHLEGCAVCRAAQKRLGKLEQRVAAGLPVPDPGEQYFSAQRARILRSAASLGSPDKAGALRAPDELRRPGRARYVWAAAAAILILAAGAATYFGLPGLGSSGPAPAAGPTAQHPLPPLPPVTGTRPDEGLPEAPSPSPTAQKTAPPPTAPLSPGLPPPAPEAAPVVPAPSAAPQVAKDMAPALRSGASARLAAMTEEAVDIGLAETPRERVVALFGAAEARLGELGQVLRQDPGLAAELAGAYLLLLGEGVKSVLGDSSESPQELALARRAAREHARGQENTLLELGALAQGPLKGTLEEALAISRELARP